MRLEPLYLALAGLTVASCASVPDPVIERFKADGEATRRAGRPCGEALQEIYPTLKNGATAGWVRRGDRCAISILFVTRGDLEAFIREREKQGLPPLRLPFVDSTGASHEIPLELDVPSSPEVADGQAGAPAATQATLVPNGWVAWSPPLQLGFGRVLAGADPATYFTVRLGALRESSQTRFDWGPAMMVDRRGPGDWQAGLLLTFLHGWPDGRPFWAVEIGVLMRFREETPIARAQIAFGIPVCPFFVEGQKSVARTEDFALAAGIRLDLTILAIALLGAGM